MLVLDETSLLLLKMETSGCTKTKIMVIYIRNFKELQKKKNKYLMELFYISIGMLSAAASLGMIHLWDVDGGLTPIDKYLYTADEHIKAGALLALGLVNCGVRNECDPALALLSDYVLHSSSNLRIGSVLGELRLFHCLN